MTEDYKCLVLIRNLKKLTFQHFLLSLPLFRSPPLFLDQVTEHLEPPPSQTFAQKSQNGFFVEFWVGVDPNERDANESRTNRGRYKLEALEPKSKKITEKNLSLTKNEVQWRLDLRGHEHLLTLDSILSKRSSIISWTKEATIEWVILHNS